MIQYKMKEKLDYHAQMHGVVKEGKRGVTNNRKLKRKKKKNKRK